MKTARHPFRLVLSVLLACALVFGMAGCNSNTGGGSSAAPLSGSTAGSGSGTEPAADSVTLDIVCSWVQGNFNYVMLEAFAEYVEKETEGRLIFNIVGGPEVIEASESAEATINGVVDACFTSTAYAAGYIPIGNVIGVSDMENADMEKSGAAEFLREEYANSGLYYYTATNGVTYSQFHIYLNSPIETLDDIKGRSIRTTAGVWTDVITELGGVPLELAFTEVYTALEQGLVEGYVAPSFSGVSEGFFEYTKHMILPGMGRTDTVMLFNQEVWEGLPEDLQTFLTDNQDAIVQMWDDDVLKPAMETNIAALEEAGGNTITLSDADADKLAGVVNDVGWAMLEKNNPSYDMNELKSLFMK